MGKNVTNEEFLKKLSIINSNVIPLEKYNGANNKILCECVICGNRWRVTPSKLLNKRGCPECAKRTVGDKKKNSNEQFLNRLLSVTSTIQPLEKYKGADTKILCKCKKCLNEWYVTPSNLYAGKGCPKCAIDKTKKKRILEQQQVLDLIKKEIPYITVDSSILEGSKYYFKCKECGYRWKSTPLNIYRKKKCPYHEGIKLNKRGLTNDEFINRLKSLTKTVEPLEEYKGIAVKIKCKCNVCGTIWKTTPSSLYANHLCPMCGKKYIGRLTKSNEEFINELKSINLDVEPLEKYVGANIKINFKCKKCNHIWSTTPHSVLRGSGCPKCSGYFKTNEDFLESYQTNCGNNNIEILSKYIDSKTKIKCKCKICGHIWKVLPSLLIRGSGCPNCNHASTSFCEQLIFHALNLRINTKSRSKEEIGEELDIVIPSKKVAIEYGSWNWHKNRLDSDQRKYNKCIKIGYKLLIIYDGVPKDELSIIKRRVKCMCYTYYLGAEKNYSLCKEVIKKIYNQLNIKNYPTEEEWNNIKNRAYLSSRRKSEIEFVKELSNVNENIELVGHYFGDSVPTQFKCKKCGYTWIVPAYSILHGSGCRNCAGTLKKTTEQFKNELKHINNNIDVLEEYRSSNRKILCRCKKCGNEWRATPSKLLKKRGCPECAKKIVGDKKRVSNDYFINRLLSVSNSIEPLENYKGADTKILCRCKKCFHEWLVTPSNLYAGKGCPKCAGKVK